MSCRSSSSSPTSRATSTRTRPTRTGATCWQRWCVRRRRGATSTTSSPTTRTGRSPSRISRSTSSTSGSTPFRILKGIEVNIRIDGSLSLPDEVLAKRDWVMASLHAAFDRNPTERILTAMENPHVDCIGHLTARKINIRPPADVDIERVVAKALETGTFLEINAQPNRLDIRDTHARLAGEAGVKVAVNTDAHQLSALAAHGDGCCAGAPRLADEGPGAEHAHVAADREAAASERSAKTAPPRSSGPRGISSRSASFPCWRRSSRVTSANACLPSPPEHGEPFADVLRDLDEIIVARDDALAEPALLRVLRQQRGGARDPRRADRGDAQLGRASSGARRLRRPSSRRTPSTGWRSCSGCPTGWHGHIEDTASVSTIAALAAARESTGGRVVVCSEEAHSSVERAARLLGLETRKVPLDERVPHARRSRSTSPTRRRSSRPSGRRPPTVGRSRSGLADACEDAGRLAARRRRLCRFVLGLSRAALVAGGRRPRGLARRERAQVAVHADGLLAPLDAEAGGAAGGVQPRPRVPADERRSGESLGLRSRARPPLSLAQALGRPSLLRPRGAAGADPGGDSARRAASKAGCATSPAGSSVRRAPSRVVCFRRRRARTRRTKSCSRASTRPASCFISHTRLNGRYVLRLAIGNERTTEADVRRAWDVLKRS